MKLINKTYLLPFVLLFVNYDIYPIIALIYILIFYIKKINIKNNKLIFKTIFLSFLITRFISGINLNLTTIWESLSQKNYSLPGRFIDLQLVLISTNCTNSNFGKEFDLVGMQQTKVCPFSVSYGPIFDILKFNFDPWLFTKILSLLVFILIYFYYAQKIDRQSSNEAYIFTLFIVSPPINFVLERMNFDIFIIILLFISSKYFKSSFLQNVIILIASLMKYYAIVFLISNVIFKTINKKLNKVWIDIVFFFSFLMIFYFTSNVNSINSKQFYVIRSDRTFGILSEALNLENIFGIKFEIFYLFIIILIVFIIFNIQKDYKYVGIFQDKICQDFLILFICLSLFSNYDYRVFFLLLIFQNIYKSKNNLLFFSYTIFIFSSPGLLNSYNTHFRLVEDYYFIYLDIPFYFLISLSILELFYFLRKTQIKS